MTVDMVGFAAARVPCTLGAEQLHKFYSGASGDPVSARVVRAADAPPSAVRCECGEWAVFRVLPCPDPRQCSSAPSLADIDYWMPLKDQLGVMAKLLADPGQPYSTDMLGRTQLEGPGPGGWSREHGVR